VLRIAFQGELGAFSDQAVGALFGPDAARLPLREFHDVVCAVADGRADFGVLPVENSVAGPVTSCLAAISACGELEIGEQVVIPIEQCLLAHAGVALEELRSVASHPVALAQCAAFLRRHPHLRAEAAYDTAGAARDVAAGGRRSDAAIAGRAAAERYGLVVIADAIQDAPDNRTRFVTVARAGAAARRALDGQEAPRDVET
jgi:prephenate dehydratase